MDQIKTPWQASITKYLSHLLITILKPYRPDWDSSWKEDISDPKFHEQVNWELNVLHVADAAAIYFHQEAREAMSLLELGLSIRSDKVIVAFPEVF
jgi:hypothetical protein